MRAEIMRAIQIKYLSATETAGAHLKAWGYAASPITESCTYSIDIEDQALLLAKRYVEQEYSWAGVEICGFGFLPNGDFVATLKKIGVLNDDG